jgi:phage terminase large subunit GpA-like protein
MARCEVCGNDYIRSFTVTLGEETHTFDSFECAIEAMAPRCSHCGCRIIGHGVDDADGTIYCCDHCARHDHAETHGLTGAKSR